MALIWRSENVKMLHVVDFDGAAEHSHKNYKIVEDICSSVIIPVEFAGGVRTMDDVKLIMDAGISRVVLGTMAIEDQEEFIKVFNYLGPQKIAVGLDILDNELIIKGRRIKTGLNYLEFAKKMSDIGVERFIVTDVARNGLLGGPNLPPCLKIAEVTNAKIVAAKIPLLIPRLIAIAVPDSSKSTPAIKVIIEANKKTKITCKFDLLIKKELFSDTLHSSCNRPGLASSST